MCLVSQHFQSVGTRSSVDVVSHTSNHRRGRHSTTPAAPRPSQGGRNRSRSPATQYNAPLSSKYADSVSGFSNGAHSQRSSAVCAICLGRNHHSFVECIADHLWDGSRKSITKHINKQLVVGSNGNPLCVDWQRGRGCSTRSHDEWHLCSRCLSPSHGAQHCSRAQMADSHLPIQ